MGIRHLNKFLRQKCTNVSINKQHLSAFRNKTIVVDTSIYLYRFSSEDALIENMYLMISMFRNYDITPLFVFDGKPPAEKMELLRKRREEKYVAQQQYNMLLNTSKNIMNPDIQHELEMLRKKMLKIKTEDINRVKQLIEYYGVNHFTPPGEADDFCAYMVLSGKADCCLSDDTDLFLYNCPYVLRNLSLINHTVICNDSNKIFEELNVSFQSFRDIMILGGTDYNVLDKELEFEDLLRLYDMYKENGNIAPCYKWMLSNGFNISIENIQQTKQLYVVNYNMYEDITKDMLIQNFPPKMHLLHKELEKEGFIFYTNVDNKLPWKSSIPV
jgi:hypothetical protein